MKFAWFGLPDNIYLDPDGSLAGTFTTPGTYSFTIYAVDDIGSPTATASGDLEVWPEAPRIQVSGPAGLIAGLGYSATARTFNDTSVSTWSLTGEPGWLTIDANGLISGATPSGIANLTYSVVGRDIHNRIDTIPVTQAVDQATASVTFPSAVTVGDAVSGKITSNLPRPTYALSGQPPWLSASADGTISGTVPASAVSGNVTGLATQENASASAAAAYGVTPVTVSVSGAFSPVNAGQAVTGAATASGGSGWAWTLEGAPAWLRIDPTTGAISGTAPNASETTPQVLAVASRNGVPVRSAAFQVQAIKYSLTMDATPFAAPYEGQTVVSKATTEIASPTWSISGAPAGTTIAQDGTVTFYSGNVDSDTPGTMTIVATAGAASASVDVPYIVKAAVSRYTPQANMRGGKNSSSPIETRWTSDYETQTGSWELSSSPAGLSMTKDQNSDGALFFVAPKVSTTTVYSITAKFTKPGAPAGVTPPMLAILGTFTFYPNLSVGTMAGPLSYKVGDTVNLAPPVINGVLGALTLKLGVDGSNINTQLGTNCGLTYNSSTGYITGTATKTCTAFLKYSATDAGNGYTSPMDNVDSPSYRLVVTAP